LKLVKEKLPFFAMSAVSSVVTFLVQQAGGAVASMEHYNLSVRLANAAVSYAGYIEKMVWPARLAVLYPHPGNDLATGKIAVCTAALAAATVCFVYFGIRRKYLLVGWLWYVGMLVPVIGLVQVGAQAMADRYTYMPLTGLFVIVAWGMREFAATVERRRVIAAVLAAAVLSALAAVTARQVRYWQNSGTLFRHTLEVSPQAWYIHNNYGNVLKDEGQVAEAIKHFNMAIAARPDFAEAYHNLGGALCKIGRDDEAVANYKKALSLKPKFWEAHLDLGTTLARMGKSDEALAELNKALEIKPNDAETLSSIGWLFADKGQLDEAAEYYRKAVAADPGYIIAHGRLGLILASQGRLDEAMEEFRIVLKARPDDVEMHCNIGILLEKKGRLDEAIEHYRRAVELDGQSVEARQLLKAALAKQNR
jgi:tetratricopeptide (TPR) repeat protein